MSDPVRDAAVQVVQALAEQLGGAVEQALAEKIADDLLSGVRNSVPVADADLAGPLGVIEQMVKESNGAS